MRHRQDNVHRAHSKGSGKKQRGLVGSRGSLTTCCGVRGGLWQEVTAKLPPGEGGGAGQEEGKGHWQAWPAFSRVLQGPSSLGAVSSAASASDSAFCFERGSGSSESHLKVSPVGRRCLLGMLTGTPGHQNPPLSPMSGSEHPPPPPTLEMWPMTKRRHQSRLWLHQLWKQIMGIF